MVGSLVGACNCDWGCPCNFDAPPTRGNCDGAYAIAVRQGRFGEVPLDGVRFVMGGSSPAAIHEGNGIGLLIIDEQSTPEQRHSLERLWRGGGVGEPFDVFSAVTASWLDPIVAPITIELDGMRSRVAVGEGALLQLETSRIPNPVTGIDEELYIDKPTGFTSTRSELGMSQTFTIQVPGLTVDATGLYAEYADFAWHGP